MVPLEHLSNIRVIIDTNHHLPFAPPHKISHPLVILKRKIYTIPSRLPVRQIHVVEGVRPVIALGTFEPRQVLHIGARQTLPGCRQVFLDPQQVDGRGGRGSAERLSSDLPCKDVELQVKNRTARWMSVRVSGRAIFCRSNTWRELSAQVVQGWQGCWQPSEPRSDLIRPDSDAA